jgi:3-hydroxybutyryl-CoA dehydrogenase
MRLEIPERRELSRSYATKELDMAESIGVVGGGIMGSGIAEVSARHGCQVMIREVDRFQLDGCRGRIEKSLDRAVHAGKLGDAAAEEALARIGFTTELEGLADSDILIEAIVEDETEKCTLFQQLSKVTADSDCLLASNTSSIPIMKLAAATSRPESVIGMHFFNPVPVLHLVELVPSLLTAPETVDRAREFASGTLAKNTILSADRAGFVVNALLIPYILAAIRMVESGFASADDIDTGIVHGCAHPMGPLALADLIGLDTTAAVAASMYAEFKEPLYAPPPLLLRMVEAGLLGRKSGRGFYHHR